MFGVCVAVESPIPKRQSKIGAIAASMALGDQVTEIREEGYAYFYEIHVTGHRDRHAVY